MRILFFTLLSLVFAIPTASAEGGSPLWAALGDETPSAELCSADKDAPRRLCVGGRFTSIAHMRNDSDFDPTPRFFDPNGQTDGQAATFLRTHVRYETGAALHVSYEMEVGWNAWSRHDPGMPDAFLPGDEGGLAYRHRQLFADARITDGVRARVGFQEIKDPSGLFLDHLGGFVENLDFCGEEVARVVRSEGTTPDDGGAQKSEQETSHGRVIAHVKHFADDTSLWLGA